VGFTDIVKRPTARGHQLTREDFDGGKPLLEAKLEATAPGLVIFTYKKAATVLYGQFRGHGFVAGLQAEGRPAFVMPGPYERGERVHAALAELRGRPLP
jgi:hypothetical protein